MSALDIVTKALLAESTVTALVGQRVNPVELPQGSELPAIVTHLIDERDGIRLSGQDQYPVARFIVDCVAATFTAADGLGDTVKTALTDWTGTAAGRTAYFVLDDLDTHDRGEAGALWRRRLVLSCRYR